MEEERFQGFSTSFFLSVCLSHTHSFLDKHSRTLASLYALYKVDRSVKLREESGISSFSNSRIKLNFPLYFDRASALPFLLEASLFSSPIEHIRSLFDQGNATSKALPSSVWINDSLLSNTPRSSWQVSLRRLMVRRN